MNKAWQLCVVDREACDFSQAPKFERIFKNTPPLESTQNGTVLFVVTTILKPFKDLDSIFYELKDIPKFAVMGGVMYSYAWLPNIKHYRWFMQDMLRPILSEQDAIDVETKFGINLENFIW